MESKTVRSFVSGIMFFIMSLLFLPWAGSAQVTLIIDTLDANNFPKIRAMVRVLEGGNAVTGLTILNFTVLEDGQIQSPITGYCSDTMRSEPLSVLLIIDKSGSMGPMYGNPIADAKVAAKNFIDRLVLQDESALLTFSNVPSYDQAWTNNKILIKSKIDAITTVGGTALWDAIYMGADILRPRTKKKVMILLTDGDDNASSKKFQEALNSVVSNGIIVFSIGLGRNLDPKPLQDIAAATNGKYYDAPTSKDLDEIYNLISKYITTTGACELQYDSKIDCLDGSVHTVEILVNANGKIGRQSATFTLPYDTTTFSYVSLSMDRNFVVEANSTIAVPILLTRISTNRPPNIFQFHLDYNTTSLELISAEPTTLTGDYSVSVSPKPTGSEIVLSGLKSITTTGELVTLTFKAADAFKSKKVPISISPPDVQQNCTVARSENGLITVSGTCERALIRVAVNETQKTELYPNTPNPFNPGTWIRYSIGKEGQASLRLYDISGREMLTLVDSELKPGEYAVFLDGSSLANGIYIIKLQAVDEQRYMRIMLLK